MEKYLKIYFPILYFSKKPSVRVATRHIYIYKNNSQHNSNLSDENELEVTNPEGLLQFTATHTSQPKLNIKAVKPGKKSSVAAFFGCNPRNDSIAQSEAPIDVFSLAKENQNSLANVSSVSTVTVSHRLAKKDEATILPTQVTISMANERLGQMSEVVFSIQEGAFYNCVMPGQCRPRNNNNFHSQLLCSRCKNI